MIWPTDDKFNSCDKPEEDYSLLEFIHSEFTEGSIVWAKMPGYPWWPAMVETDPDTGDYMAYDGIDSDAVGVSFKLQTVIIHQFKTQ